MSLNLERRLIEEARAGGAALERLIAAVWPEAYKVAFGILRDGGLAEDAAQEACAAMARSLPALKNDVAFYGWFYKIVANHAITAERRRPRTHALDVLEDRAMPVDPGDDLDLYRALQALPPVQRAAVLMHYYAGLSSGEIGAATGVPSSTVRFHLMLARRALRKALSATGTPSLAVTKEILSDVR